MDKKVISAAALALLLPGAAPAQEARADGAPAVSTASLLTPDLPWGDIATLSLREALRLLAPRISTTTTMLELMTQLPPVNTGYAVPDVQPKKTLTELLSGYTPPEDARKTQKSVQVYEGSSDVNEVRSVEIPEGISGRLLWKFEAVSEGKRAGMSLTATSPLDKKYMQGVSKEIIFAESEAFGVVNLCLPNDVYRKFNIRLKFTNARWRVEVQQLQ